MPKPPDKSLSWFKKLSTAGAMFLLFGKARGTISYNRQRRIRKFQSKFYASQVHNAYRRRRIRGIDTSEPSGDIIFVFPCVFLMAIFFKYLCNFFLSGLDPTTYITKSVFLRGMYRYQICWGKTHRKSTFLNLHFVYMLFYHCMKYQNGCF